MPKWIFEPGHTAAGFRARHMMVSWVPGQFGDVHGSLQFDPENPKDLAVEAIIEISNLWTGEKQRDAHLRADDFLDAEQHPTITFQSTASKCVGAADFAVTGDLSIRGTTRPVVVLLHYLGKWQTPFWTESGDMGPIARVGFAGESRINRHDFGVSWSGEMETGGVVVSDDIEISIDIEALLESDLKKAQGNNG